jgi:hypothetical protein
MERAAALGRGGALTIRPAGGGGVGGVGGCWGCWGVLGGGGGLRLGGGVNRLSAYASNPCYLCVAAALSVSKVLTLRRPRCSPATRAAGAGGRRQRPKGLWPPAEPPTPCVPRACDCALFFSALHRASDACRWRSVRAYSVLGSTQGRRAILFSRKSRHAPVASRWRMRCLFELPPVLLRRFLGGHVR